MGANARSSPLAGARAPEPAALMRRPSKARRDRSWERENRGFTYRIDARLNEAAKEAVEAYEAQGLETTVSAVVEAWIRAGRDAWLRGEVEVTVERIAATSAACPQQAAASGAA